ncbi:MAG: PAS domain S-box protein [Bacteroidales bacterium]|nr:PAS domain S-box protein [Bacteroidales bacterium]
MKRIIIFISILLLNLSFVYTQEKGQLFISNYSPHEYRASTQNWAIVQDKRGVMYFGNQGVLEFDGETWRIIPITNRSSARSLSVDSLGVIYVGAVGEFGYLSPNEKGKLQYISLSKSLDSTYKNFADVWCNHSTKNGIYFLTNNFLYHYTGKEIKVIKKTAKYFYLSMLVNGELYVQEIGAGLKKIVEDSLQLIPKGDFFSNSKIFSILPFEKNKLLIGTRNKGLFIYSSINGKTNIVPFKNLSSEAKQINQFILDNKIYGGIKLQNNNFAISTIRNGVVVFNTKGEVLDIINKESSLQNNVVYSIFEDRNEDLWLGLDKGISHVDINSTFNYWNEKNNLGATIIDITRFNGKIYISTGAGVYYLNNNNTPSINQFVKVSGIDEQSWSLLKFKVNSKEVLLAGTSYGIYQIIDGKAKKVVNNIEVFKLYKSTIYPEKIFVGLKGGLTSISWNKKERKWIDEGKIINKNVEIRSIAEDENNNLWAAAIYQGVYKIKHLNDKIEITHYDTSNSLKSVREIKIFNFNKRLIFTTDRGVYRFNYKTNTFYQDELFFNIKTLKTQRINSFAEDIKGNVWVNGDLVLIKQDNKFIIDTIPFKRISQNGLGAIFIDKNNFVWAGGTEGLYKYSQTKIKNYQKPYYTLIRKITSCDSVIFYGTNFSESKNNKKYISLKQNKKSIPKILFQNNSLIFEYATSFYENKSSIEYSYYLKGFDKKWSSWTSEPMKEYNFLHNGTYSFMVKAKNLYNIESETAVFEFEILPPWYRTYYAYLSYLLISFLIVRFFVFIRTKRLRAQNKKLEDTVVERTSEILQQKEEIFSQTENLKQAYENISMQNAELEQQKEEIFAQTEQLKSKNVELEKLSVVARETDNAIAIFDKAGNIEWVNDGYIRMYGFTLEQLIKEKGTNIVSHSINPKIKDVIQSCIDNKKTAIYQKFTITKKDKGLWIQTTLTPIFDGDEEVINFIAIDSDITKIKDAENEIIFQKEEIENKSKQLEKLSIVARETNNAIAIMDKEGNFEWVNESFSRMYGYSLKQFIKEKGGNIVSASYHKNIKILINNWLGRKDPISYQALNVTKSGVKIWAQTTLTPIIDDKGDVSKIVSIDSNITKLKQAEEQIQKQRDELQKANITKDKFFSIIAHDLRSPFATFVSLTNVIYQNFENFTQEKLKRIVFDLHNSAEKTFNLLENLLDWSRSQKGEIKFHPKKTEINTLINENIELFQNLSNNKNIIVSAIMPDNTYAFFDEDMIRTVIRNLLSNALKFTPPKGKIEVKVSEFEENVEVSVSDNGIGIEKEDLMKIFRIDFHHTTLGTDDEKGTGLGLILCKEFVEKNKGTINIKSQVGKGSTFTFTLPSK